MKVQITNIAKLRITEAPALDPIDVYLEDVSPSKGQITITCYGQSWSAYWGGMGGRTIAQFFCDCDEHYIAGNLSHTRTTVFDPQGLGDKARREVCARRRRCELTAADARRLYGAAEQLEGIDDPRDAPASVMREIFGEDWWLSLPTKPNPEYEYLCRIIKAVQAALQTQEAKAV